MVLTEIMILMLFFLEFYLNLGPMLKLLNVGLAVIFAPTALSSIHCKIGNLLLATSMLKHRSQRGEISYKVILNGYLRGRMIRSDSRLFPPMLAHGSKPSSFEYHKLSQHKIGPCEVVQKINNNAHKLKLPSYIHTFDVFNVNHLIPYRGNASNDDEPPNSRANSF
ncbi:hypothetical protein AMTRI_Chr13g88870 [Amborella trichopoda]